jgi:ABC-type antimicrobial peptide transport system permease subunit
MERLVGGIVRDMQPTQSIDSIARLEAIEAQWLAPFSLRTVLIALFGLLALVVTLSGVVGVMSYSISQRVREIGVHMAVGADPGRVTSMFVLQGLRTLACGLLLGLGLALFAAPLFEPMLYRTSAFNPAVYAAVILLLTAVVAIAIYVPARRAGMLSPVEALHAK